jgi:O-antigen/teichoic acid export membrane protein
LAALNAGLRALTLLGKFALQLWIARVMSAEAMGLYGLMVAALAIAVFAVGLEYHYFTMRELAGRARERVAGVLRDQLVVHLLTYAAAAAALAALHRLGLLKGLPLRWFVPLLLVEHLSQEAYCALNALSRPVAANLVLFTRAAGWAFVLVPLGAAHPALRRLDEVFLAWMLGGLASLAIAAWSLRALGWRRALREGADWTEIRQGLRTAGPFIVITGSSMAMLFVDRFIIDAYHGLAVVGVYTFFAGITTSIITLVNAGVSMIRMPRLVRAWRHGSSGDFPGEVRRAWGLGLAGALSLAAVAAMVISPMLRFVARPAYSEAVGVFWLLLVAAVIRSAAEVPLYALYARGSDRALLLINLAGMATAVGANLALVKAHGAAGAAVSAGAGALVLLLGAGLTCLRPSGSAVRTDLRPGFG